MPALYRASDAVLTVCQNNQRQAIEIYGANEAAQALIGQNQAALEGKNLQTILHQHVNEAMDDYLEFEEAGNDLQSVLQKVKDVRLRTNAGEFVKVHLKIVRSESLDGQAWFRLIMQKDDEDNVKSSTSALIRTLLQQFKGHEALDSTTDLPDRTSLLKDVEITAPHATSGALRACFAVIEIDNYVEILGEYSKVQGAKLIKHIALLCRQKLRGGDVIGMLSTSSIGIILMDISSESARLVLNRLRWIIASQSYMQPGHKPIALTASIAFHVMGGQSLPKELVLECEHAVRRAQKDGANRLMETGASESQTRAHG